MIYYIQHVESTRLHSTCGINQGLGLPPLCASNPRDLLCSFCGEANLYSSVLFLHVAHTPSRDTSVHDNGGSDAGSFLRLIDSCITQLKAQRPSRTCNESKEELRRCGRAGRTASGRTIPCGPTHSLTLTLTLTLTHSHPRSHPLALTHSLSLTLTHSHSRSRRAYGELSDDSVWPYSLTHSHSHSLSPTLTPTHYHPLTLTHSHSHSRSRRAYGELSDDSVWPIITAAWARHAFTRSNHEQNINRIWICTFIIFQSAGRTARCRTMPCGPRASRSLASRSRSPPDRSQRDWYFIAEQPAPAPHLARAEGRDALTHMC